MMMHSAFAAVERLLRENADEAGFTIHFYETLEWMHVQADGPIAERFRPFGWIPPAMPGGEAHACPSKIVVHTGLAGVEDNDFESYVTNIAFLMCVLTANWELPPDERIRLAEETLRACSPEALALMSKVELAALDLQHPIGGASS